MKKIAVGFIFAVLLAAVIPDIALPESGHEPIISGGETNGDDALAAKIDVFFSGIYKAGEPGAAVLVKKDGRVILRKGYGMADLELGVPIEPEMVFRLGSITKQFTAVGILKLVERGKLALDDPLTRFLPDYPVGGKTITIRHLLTHTSGIKSYTDLAEWLPLWRKDMSVDEIIALFKDKPAEFAPGERWQYNNSGYILLGAIIEKISGSSYKEFIKKEIFEPLGMVHSFYGDAAQVIPRRIPGYQLGNAGYENAPYLSMTQPYAAGSLLSSVDDLAAWSEALLSGRVLKKETLEQAFTPYLLSDGRTTGYGFGWFVSDYKGRRIIEHAGGINGFITDILFMPEDGVFVAILCNGIGGGHDPQAEGFRAATLVLNDPYVDPEPISLDGRDLDLLAGVYADDRGDELHLRRDGTRLLSQRSGGAIFEMHPVSRDEFFFKDSLSRMKVRRAADGNAAGLEVTERIGPADVYIRTDKPLPAERKEIALDPAFLDRLVGEYEINPGFTITITRDGRRLMGQATGQPIVELFPESETAFFLKVADARIVFALDAAGKATGLTLIQGGLDLPAKKVK